MGGKKQSTRDPDILDVQLNQKQILKEQHTELKSQVWCLIKLTMTVI